jgi:hypothetical protein
MSVMTAVDPVLIRQRMGQFASGVATVSGIGPDG